MNKHRKPKKPAATDGIPWGVNPALDAERRAYAEAARKTLEIWRRIGYSPRGGDE